MPAEPPPAAGLCPTGTVPVAALSRETVELAPATHYPRRPPAFVGGEPLGRSDRAALERHWHAGRQDAPAVLLHRLGAASVEFPGVVRLADGRVVAESLHNMTAARRQAAIPPRGTRRPAAHVAGAAVLLARAGSGNYGHWLVEHLGALLLLRQALPALLPQLVVQDRRDSAMWRVYEDGARLAGVDPVMLRPVGGRPVEVAELLLPGPASAHPYMKHPAVMARLAALAPRRAATEMLFLRRSNTSKRVLRNADAVQAAAEQLGFRVVEPGRMSFAEQVEAFSAARVVAGVSGAELTNIAFMPRGGEVVCLLPAVGRNLFFWDICCLRGHGYWSLFGRPLTGRGGGHDDFDVDVPLAVEVMRRAVSGS